MLFVYIRFGISLNVYFGATTRSRLAIPDFFYSTIRVLPAPKQPQFFKVSPQTSSIHARTAYPSALDIHYLHRACLLSRQPLLSSSLRIILNAVALPQAESISPRPSRRYDARVANPPFTRTLMAPTAVHMRVREQQWTDDRRAGTGMYYISLCAPPQETVSPSAAQLQQWKRRYIYIEHVVNEVSFIAF